jgi:rod shape-determining protein MreB
MIKRLMNKFGTTVYVQIWGNRIRVVDTVSGVFFDEAPLVAIETTRKGHKVIVGVGNSVKLMTVNSNVTIVNPFSHPRALLNDFIVAEKLLQHVFQQILGKKFISPSPAVVIQPMEKIEGELTIIERKAFRELALGAGARDVVLNVGAPINLNNLDFETLKKNDRDLASISIKTNKSPLEWLFVVVWLGVIVFTVININ